MNNGMRIGRIAGIEIMLDWSLLIIFLVITLSLARGVFPSWHPEWSAGLDWATAVAAAILFFASVLIHDLSHALVGRATGTQVDRITLFMFGGIAQMQGEPRSWKAELAIAIVGPVTSLLLGCAFALLAGAMVGPIELDPDEPMALIVSFGPLASLLFWLGSVNMMLAVFNLVPGFPLDGGRVLRAIMWGASGNLLRATHWASRIGQAFSWLLMGSGFAMMLGVQIPVIPENPLRTTRRSGTFTPDHAASRS